MKEKHEKRVLLVDTSALVHRAFHAYPTTLSKPDGTPSNALYGFSVMLLETINRFKPEHIICALDSSGPTNRKKEYEQYKAHRKPIDEMLRAQLPLVPEIIDGFNIPSFAVPGDEADDILGTLARSEELAEYEKIIVTGDQDILQLIDDKAKILVYIAGSSFTEGKLYNSADMQAKYGFTPAQMVDYKSLLGDASDNIKGVPGIGKTGGSNLLDGFGTLENIYQTLEASDAKWLEKPYKSYVQKLTTGKESAFQSYKLATIKCDVELDKSIVHKLLEEDYTLEANKESMAQLFSEYNFKSLIKKLGFEDVKTAAAAEASGVAPSTIATDYKLLDTPEKALDFIKTLDTSLPISFDTETDSLDQMTCKLLGLGLSVKAGQGVFISADALADSAVKTALQKMFNSGKNLVAHNLKYDVHALANYGIEILDTSNCFDTMIAVHLLRAGEGLGSLGLKELARVELGMEMQNLATLTAAARSSDNDSGAAVKASKSASAKAASAGQPTFFQDSRSGQEAMSAVDATIIPLQTLSDYCCSDCDATLRLYEKLKPELEADKNLENVFRTIEMPLTAVLIEMERNGIELQRKPLEELGKQVNEILERITKEIYEEAGQELNINSPRQVGEILFEKMRLQDQFGVRLVKNKSGGFSTDERTLQNFSPYSTFVQKLLQYRELAKLKSTYIEGLEVLLNGLDAKFIHTNYRQTIASTGRLSSTDPNLQNIPVSGEIGKKIRKAFSAGKGRDLLAFDYAQQELRVLAHFSNEDKLVEAFTTGQDIHSLTASEILNVPLAEVTSDQRRIGKTVNFGVIYGISGFGLADRLKIPQKEAQVFIDAFFAKYPKIAEYFRQIRVTALEQGAIYTFAGRKRNTAAYRSANPKIRGALEREILNFPLQGSAADLMKMAMLQLYKEVKFKDGKLHKYGLKMHLQIHDELVFSIAEDTSSEDIKAIAKEIEAAMSGVAKLSVPLDVDGERGKNWYDMSSLV